MVLTIGENTDQVMVQGNPGGLRTQDLLKGKGAGTERVLRNPHSSRVYFREVDRAGRKFRTNFSFKILS